MARKGKTQDSTTLPRTSRRLIGGGLVLVGLLMAYGAVAVQRGDDQARARALLEQSFVQATCTVEGARSETRKDAEGTEYTDMTVTFQLRNGADVITGLSYDYPSYWFNKVSAKQALERDLLPGAQIRCFHAPDNPRDAVLVLKARPDDEPPSAAGAWLFVGIGALLGALGLYVALSNRRWKAASETAD